MTVKFHPDAREEFDDAVNFYEREKPGTGGRFRAVVEDAIRIIRRTPRSWPEIGEGVRRYLTKTFPYAIHYTQEEHFILIVAVMHSSREPDYWRDRLE